MNLEKVVFGFFVLLAATLNFGFFIGDIADPELHNIYELFAAIVVSLIATVLKFGDRTQIGAVHLATSLVADLQLVAAALAWTFASHIAADGTDAVGDGERGLAVRGRAARQRRLGGAARHRDRVLPPPVGGGRGQPAARLLVAAARARTGARAPTRPPGHGAGCRWPPPRRPRRRSS